jgi:membrane protease YdiL (CAAX protease family)
VSSHDPEEQASAPRPAVPESPRAVDGALLPAAPSRSLPDGVPPNADLLLPYLAPYGAYVAIATLAAGLGREIDYSIRILVTGLLLAVLWKRYQRIVGPRPVQGSILVGVGAGIVGVLLWIALVLPFQDAHAGTPFTAPAVALRIVAATLVVPFIEELLFRGYLLGVVTQWQRARASGAADPLGVALDRSSVREIEPGAWTWLALIVSSAAFALGHAPAQWLAASAYGLLMAALWIARRDLVAPIAAHATTNLVLYLYIYFSGSWGLW